MKPKQLIVKGHTLRYEGTVRNEYGRWVSGSGEALCSCGLRSPKLPSTAARQRWQRDHKLAVLAEQAAL